MRRASVASALLMLLTMLATASAVASELERALERVDDGRIRFSFETREGVWGDGRSVMTTDGDELDWDCDCEEGPGRMQITLRHGDIRSVKFRVGGSWRAPRDGDIDLGELDSGEVSSTLLQLAAREGVDDFVFAATVAEGFDGWRELLAMARDREVDGEVREQCIFWLGQEASEVATRGLEEIVSDDDQELQLREHAIFALSQQESDEVFESLRHIALSNRHPQLREQALFWLGQVDDPRVLDFFEEILFESNDG